MSTPPLIAEHTIHGNSRIGIFKRTTGKFKGYELYELTDHLGNVRAVLRKGELGTIALVTSKADYYPFEDGAFKNVQWTFLANGPGGALANA